METQDSNNATTTQQTAQNTASTPTQTGAANPGSTEAKLFTQAELEKHINARIEKAAERDARIKAELLSQLGLDPKSADFDALKSTIEDARKRKESEMSEAQKAQAIADKAIKDRDEAIAERDRERAERRNDKIASVLSTAASKLHAKDTDDVLRYARDKYAEDLNAMMDESGTIDTKKVDALLEKIKADKGHYFSDGKVTVQATVIPSNANGRVASQRPTIDTSLLPKI